MLIDALPAALEEPVEVSEAEIDAVFTDASKQLDEMGFESKEEIDAWKAEQAANPAAGMGGGVAAGAGSLLGSLAKGAGSVATGGIGGLVKGIAPLLPENSPVRHSMEAVSAVLDGDFKAAFAAARKLAPEGSKLRTALDLVPVGEAE